MPVVGKRPLGLVLHPDRDPGAAAERVVTWARSHGGAVLARPQDAARCPDGVDTVPDAEFADSVDALVSLGADGTMLGALRLAAAKPIPVLGVNRGSLGFLVDVEPEELPEALDRCNGSFSVESHGAVVARLGDEEIVAFNDLAPARVQGEGVVEAELEVDGRQSGRYRCDAIVVSTPLGSTAYSYAAGGPIVSPALDAVVVAPVAPMAGVRRPMVSPAESQSCSRCPRAAARRSRSTARSARTAPAASRSTSGCGRPPGWSCGSTRPASSAATRSSSACSTCPSCPTRSAPSPPASACPRA